MKVGDIVEYINDWKGKRPWYLYSIKDDLCTIVLLRNGEYKQPKVFYGKEEYYLNASIVNLNISNIKPYVN